MDQMQRSATEQRLQALGAERASAELHGDSAFLEQLLADNFVGVGPRGFTLTKEQWIARTRSGDLTCDALTWEPEQVRVYGDAAIVIGRETSQGKYQGQENSGQFRETQFY
ncbi:MAG TPA: nuclear transport factor 2 family protein, partial [Ktedonobacterales bacterium]|nr:nuclear transport factor 2 family protein [Ktedonobacterales bacterium]